MTTSEALLGFYKFHKLNLTKDFKSHCVRVYIGCILAPVPNLKSRKKYLVFHDLHHVLTGYGIDRVGESEVSAWELGSKSCRKPIISIMNLFALSTGFILSPVRVIEAYYSGCRSKNLYYLFSQMTEAEIKELNIAKVKQIHIEVYSVVQNKWWRQIEFIGFLFISLIIHLFMLIAGNILIQAEKVNKKFFKKI